MELKGPKVPYNQSHYFPRPLLKGLENEGAWGMWAYAPSDQRVVIFVHGFGGEATRTWFMFPKYLMEEPKLNGTDVIFYGYNSLKRQASASAGFFYEFLQGLAESPAAIINSSLSGTGDRPDKFKYKEIVLVAHSLGAIVCRKALITACEESKSWANQTHLVLYAPAHRGADLKRLVKEAVFSCGPTAFAGVWLHYYYPVLQDVEVNSPMLTDLLNKTKDLLNAFPTLKSKRTIQAEIDRVVSQTEFCSNPKAIWIRGTSHSSVCKPCESLREPYEKLVEIF